MHVQEDYYHSQVMIKELASELVEPSEGAMARLKHLVRFLKGRTHEVKEMYMTNDRFGIDVHVDSNWAGCLKTSKSTDCVVLDVCGYKMINSVKTQHPLAQSSGEAELGGVHRGAILGVHVQNIWNELFRQLLPITVFTDSAAGKVMATRRGVGRVRHLEVRRLYVQQLVNEGKVRLQKISGQ